MFRLRRLPEDDTITLLQCISSECISRSGVGRIRPVFIDFPSMLYVPRRVGRGGILHKRFQDIIIVS